MWLCMSNVSKKKKKAVLKEHRQFYRVATDVVNDDPIHQEVKCKAQLLWWGLCEYILLEMRITSHLPRRESWKQRAGTWGTRSPSRSGHLYNPPTSFCLQLNSISADLFVGNITFSCKVLLKMYHNKKKNLTIVFFRCVFSIYIPFFTQK